MAVLFAIYFIYNKASFSTSDNSLKRHKMGALAALQFPTAESFAPKTTFVDENGNSHSLNDYKGKVLVVNLWATWCPPCIREMPSLGRLANNYKNGDLKVIAISADKKADTAKAQEKLKELSGGVLEFYHDPDMGLPSELKVTGFPTTIIYDQNGKEVARLMSTTEWDSVDARSLLDDVIKYGAKK